MMEIQIDKWLFLLNSFFIIGLNYAFEDVLSSIPKFYDWLFIRKIRKIWKDKLFISLKKPLFHCINCMVLLWGFIGYLFQLIFSFFGLVIYIIYLYNLNKIL